MSPKRTLVEKIEIAVLTFPVASPLLALTSFAAETLPPQQAAKELCGDCPISTVQQIYGILKKAVQYTYVAFFFVAIFFILLAAYNFLFARGDPQKIKNARNEILWAIVAIVIALLSVAAASIVQSFINPNINPNS